MDRQKAVRRALHMSAPVYLVYYIIPDEPFPDAFKWYGIPVILAGVAVFEALRLKKGTDISGLRGYEKERPSALAYGAFGIGLGLVFFPPYFTVPAVLCMAFIDPLLGETRERTKDRDRHLLYRGSPPVALAFAIFTASLVLLGPFDMARLLVLSCTGAAAVVALEGRRLWILDDDFLMVMGPLACLATLERIMVSF